MNQKLFPIHTSAKPSHYDEESVHYDTFNEKNSKIINQTIETILKKYDRKSVLDLACGTGSQVFWLAKRGFEVVGVDFNEKMLKVARAKSRKERPSVKLLRGDMRKVKVGQFDATITIFNAVGHLTKPDFEKAMRNIRKNLHNEGIYIFDIFNLEYLLKGERITTLTIDWFAAKENAKVRTIQYSTIDDKGVLVSYTTSYEEKGAKKPKITYSSQTLQVYTAKQLRQMLKRNGFKVIEFLGIDGSKFDDIDTERILVVAKRA